MVAQVGIYGEGLSEPSYKDTIAYQMFIAPVRAAKVRCPAMAIMVHATQFAVRAACKGAVGLHCSGSFQVVSMVCVSRVS